MSAPPFTHFGRYRILEELGRGAMGVVYLAEDESLQRQVAVKAMLLSDDAQERAEHERRFRQEAKAAGGLNHPNVITIHDLGREGDWLYIAMELMRGTELRDLLDAGPLPLADALDIGVQVAHGLAAAHARGIVHRDIKPSNIMVQADGHAKIMDFGVARVQASEVRTQTGVMLGSPKYMSPEQVGGHPVDHRSDIFSLGSMLYEVVTGRPAFVAADLGELLNGILHATPPPAAAINPAVPAALDAVLARAMEKNPARRYQDASDMARELEACRTALAGTKPAVDLDLFGATAPAPLAGGDATVVAAAAPALRPAPQFDSGAALQRLIEHARGAPERPRRRIGWIAAYVAAAAVAAWVALG